MTVRDEFQTMTDDQIKWYTKGYDVAKSEGWSVSQKEAIRELFESLINCGFTYGWKEINPIPDDKFEEAIKYGFEELEAITKGKEQ
jgi:hypothetical protein